MTDNVHTKLNFFHSILCQTETVKKRQELNTVFEKFNTVIMRDKFRQHVFLNRHITDITEYKQKVSINLIQ